MRLTARGTLLRAVEAWGTVITLEAALAPQARSERRALEEAGRCAAQAVDQCEQDMARIDRLLSVHRQDSLITALRAGLLPEADLDRSDPDHALVVGVLSRCRLLRAATRGAFDPWAVRGGLDPSAFVKGWGAGRLADHLWQRLGAASGPRRRTGVVGVCVNAGGDVSVRGCQADGAPWRIGVRDPRETASILTVIQARSGHVATSGCYERGAHIEPTGAWSRAAGVLSATVWGPDDGAADALSTALFLAGREGAPWFAELMGSGPVPRWGAYVVQDGPGGPSAWRLGRADALA